ncbi:hypothetical protein PENTCL1PPCAC_20203, partial [Pristionchus entomophagus]
EAPVSCLLCEKKIKTEDVSEHIHAHFGYYPYRCNCCDYESSQHEGLKDHIKLTSHNGDKLIDLYKQQEVQDKINEFAAKYGKDELLKKKKCTSSPLRPSQSNTSGSRRVPESPSADDDNEPPSTATKHSGEEVKKDMTDNKSQSEPPKMNEKDLDESDDEYKDIKELRKEIEKTKECKICHEMIPFALDKRQAHVRDKHMNDVSKGQNYQSLLEEKTASAFPFLVSNCRQCYKCQWPYKEFRNYRSRPGHVARVHCSKQLSCPINGCPFENSQPGLFPGHFEEAHSIMKKKWMLFVPQEFLRAMDKHKSMLKRISQLIFTVEIPNEGVPNRAKSMNADDSESWQVDEDSHLAATPPNPTPNQPKVKRQRSKPLSEDDEEDNDLSVTNKKKKEEIKKKKGAIEIIELSDDEEEKVIKEEPNDKEEVKSDIKKESVEEESDCGNVRRDPQESCRLQ